MFLRTLSSIIGGRVVKVEHIVTYRCNKRCKYCHYWQQKANELSTAELIAIADKYIKQGATSWNISGGEPLLRNDLEEFIDYLKKRKIYITLNTNGLLVKNKINMLKKVDLLGISLDKMHCPSDKEFNNIIDVVKLCKEQGINIYILSVMDKKSLEDDCKILKQYLDVASRLKVKIAVLPEYDAGISDFRKGIKVLKEYKKNHNIMISNSTIRWFEKGMPKIKCYAGKYFLMICPDGKIKPCMFFDKMVENTEVCSNPSYNCQLAYLECNNLFSLKPSAIMEFLKLRK